MQTYLYRIICGAAISAAIQTLPLRGTVRKIVLMLSGCLMVILTLAPLARLDFKSLNAVIPETFTAQRPELSDKNDALLQDLICSQTEELIESTALSCGIECTAIVSLQYDKTVGSYLPYSVRLNVTRSEGSFDALKTFLQEQLAIPEERQTWVLN